MPEEMILFRADGNSLVGSGHIMRCLSLADAFQDIGLPILFVTADNCLQEVIQKRGYECTVLHTKYDQMDRELPNFLSLLQKIHPHCVILDHYFTTPNYMETVKQNSPLVYIDDLNAFDYPADIVVNYTLYGNTLKYPKNKRYILGPQYALLRTEFQTVPKRQIAKQVRHVLLSTGGADPEHVALGCVRHLRNCAPGVTYHIILGAMNQDVAAIERLAAGQDCIVLHRQVSDMRSLMLQCDAAVSAGGTTLFELCACGLPAVTYVLADNQIMNAASFEKAGLMLNAGDIRKDSRFVERIFELLTRIADNHSLRQRMAERMQELIDGNGAIRLAKAIQKYFGV